MAERYAGRHIRQARHGAWLIPGSARSRRQSRRRSRGLLPAAAALIVSGVLFGGAGVLIQISPVTTGTNLASYRHVDDSLADIYAGDPASTDLYSTDPYAFDPYALVDPSATPSGATPTGLDETASAIKVVARGACDASFYDEPQETANGEWFDPDGYTAAHTYLPFNTLVRVIANGKSVIVRINDRGPYLPGRCLDLSRAAFAGLASLSTGVLEVRYEVLG